MAWRKADIVAAEKDARLVEHWASQQVGATVDRMDCLWATEQAAALDDQMVLWTGARKAAR